MHTKPHPLLPLPLYPDYSENEPYTTALLLHMRMVLRSHGGAMDGECATKRFHKLLRVFERKIHQIHKTEE
jgi:hypothetical protein